MNNQEFERKYQKQNRIFSRICETFDIHKEEYNQNLSKDLKISFDPNTASVEISGNYITQPQLDLIQNAIFPFCGVTYLIREIENKTVLRIL